MRFLSVSLVSLLPLAISCETWDLFPESKITGSTAPYELTILSAESCPLPPGLDPKEVTIQSYHVRLTGGDPGGVPANYFYASLLSTDGGRYLSGYTGCQPVLSGPPLASGESREAYINFALPPTKTPETLIFSPALLKTTGELHPLKIDLLKQVELKSAAEQ